MESQSNSELHPEAWAFYVEEARNIMGEPDLVQLGNYRIPVPNMSGDFIYANTVESLWCQFIREWYRPQRNSHSVYGQIQYIVQTFKG
jgi:hypothetical protein